MRAKLSVREDNLMKGALVAPGGVLDLRTLMATENHTDASRKNGAWAMNRVLAFCGTHATYLYSFYIAS